MKKKNGFISTTIIFAFFITFLIFIVIIMNTYTNTRTRQNVIKNDIKSKLTFENTMSMDGLLDSQIGMLQYNPAGELFSLEEEIIKNITKTTREGTNIFVSSTAGSGSEQFTCNSSECYNNNHTDDSTAYIQFKVNKEGYYRVCYVTSSESYDKGYFYVDGKTIVAGVGGEKTGCLDLGKLTTSSILSASYSKDGSESVGNDKFSFYLESYDENDIEEKSTGIRYTGKNPNNYVWFNGERWRIVGVFDDETHGVLGQKLIKIVRNESLGTIKWDHKQKTGSSSGNSGSNDWSDSQLMMMLNSAAYLNTGYKLDGSLTHVYSTTAIASSMNVSSYTNFSNDTDYPFTCSGTTCTSTNHTDSSTSIMTFKVPTTGTYQVCYTASSESNYDKGYFYIDSRTIVDSASGTTSNCVDLGTVTTSMTLKAKYSKDSSDSANDDNFSFRIEQTSGINVVDSNGKTIFKNMGSYFNESFTAYQPAIASADELSLETIELGRLSTEAQNMIASAKWNLSTTSSDLRENNSTGRAVDWYNYERNIDGLGSRYSDARPVAWYGKVGLITPSDYGYATGGNPNRNTREKCLNDYAIYKWSSTNLKADCGQNDWLSYINSSNNYDAGVQAAQWTITPTEYSAAVMIINENGYINTNGPNKTIYNVRPAVYLKQNVERVSGTGTYDDPFVLEINTEKPETLLDHIISLAPSEDLAIEHGIRYFGINPNNWVCFSGNCSSSNMWRIVSITEEEYDTDADNVPDKTGYLVKIRHRTSKQSKFQYDSGGSNDWTGSSSRVYANTDFYDSLFFKDRVANVKWHTGSINVNPMDGIPATKTPSVVYDLERSKVGPSSNPNAYETVAHVGNIYASDVGFGVGSDGTKTRQECLNTAMTSWVHTECKSWLNFINASATSNGSSYVQWTVNGAREDKWNDGGCLIWSSSSSSYLSCVSSVTTNGSNVRFIPTLYLNPDILYTSGSGTYNDPFVIS